MESKQNLRTSFAVDRKHEAFYTGGQVLFTDDGEHMLCKCTDIVNVVNVDTGTVVHSFGQTEDGEVTSFIISPDNTIVVLALRNLQLKQFDFTQKTLTRSWKAIHMSPVTSMGFDSTSTLLATGGSDSTIKIWDIIQQYCTHNLRGHRGVVNIVKYHPNPDKLQLLSASEDYNIHVWDLKTSTCISKLEGHYSVITGLQFSANGNILYSGGRDKVINIWSLKDYTKTKTIPVYETIEGVILLGDDEYYSDLGVDQQIPHVVTGGSKGVLKIWNTQSSQCVYTQTLTQPLPQVADDADKSDESTQNIVSLMECPKLGSMITVSFDHNIILYNRNDLAVKKQFTGYNDEILDLKYFGPDETHIVVATNSELIKVFELKTWNAQILRGHTDIVLALDVYASKDKFASSSKDNTIRVWKASGDMTIHCIATAYGHTKDILSLAFSRLTFSFLASASEDLTMKVWSIPEDSSGPTSTLKAMFTEKAHDKDINSVVVSPNDKLLASGSQDKTAKLWSVAGLKLLGIFRGHKRGIWSVRFSPVDQCIATASSDSSVKIWSLSDYTCVRTFEGHDAQVLNVKFINRGMQLLTGGSDGLLKLWTVKTSECLKTFDDHEDKIWTLSVSKDESQVITGGADSTIIVWKDVTDTEEAAERAKQVDFILKEQKLMNLIQQKKYIKALALAINLEQPFRVLTIMKEVMSEGDNKHGLKSTLSKLRADQKDAILRFSVQWNTNSKHCHVAQHVLQTVLWNMSPEDLLCLPNAKSSLEGLLPYTIKHMERMNRLLQQSMFVGYTWNSSRLATEFPSGSVSEMMPATTEPMDTTNYPTLPAPAVDQAGSDDDSSSSGGESGQKPRKMARMNADADCDSSDDDSSVEDGGTAVKICNENEEDSSDDDEEEEEEDKNNVSVCLRVKARTPQATRQMAESESSSDSDDSEVIPSPTSSPDRRDNNNISAATPSMSKSLKKKVSSSVMHSGPSKRQRPSDQKRINMKKQRKSFG